MAVTFVSHSTRTKEIAVQVQSALEAAQRTVFVDSDHETGISAGTDWLQERFRSINASNAIVFLNSTESQASKRIWRGAPVAGRDADQRVRRAQCQHPVGKDLWCPFLSEPWGRRHVAHRSGRQPIAAERKRR